MEDFICHSIYRAPKTLNNLNLIGSKLVSANESFNVIDDIAIFLKDQKLDYWTDIDSNEILLNEDKIAEFLKEKYELTLEVGCGNGRCLNQLKSVSNHVFGIDNSISGLRACKQRKIPNSYFALADMESLPFPDNTFDLVASITVIEHIKHPEKMIQEIRRVLKPNGKLLIRNDAWFYGVLEKYRVIKKDKGPDPTHVNMMTPDELRGFLVRSGFRIDSSAFFPFYRFSKKWNGLGVKVLSTKANFVCTNLK